MRVASFVPEFPKLWETFIRMPLAQLHEQGVDMTVYTHRAPASAAERARLSGPLADRIVTWDAPRSRRRRLAGAPRMLWRGGTRAPAVMAGALADRRAPDLSLSLVLPYAAARILHAAERYDLVHAHFGVSGRLACALRRAGAIRAPIVTSFYGYDLSQELTRRGAGWYRSLFSEGDRFLVPSRLWRDRLIELGCPSARVEVVHLPVDCTSFAPPASRPSPPPLRVLSVARFVEKKGLEDGIEAVAEVQRRGVEIDYRIIGEGPLEGRLVERIRRRGASAFIRLERPVGAEGVARAMREAHLLLAPSRTASDGDQEGTPVVIIEAMATGLPVLSTHHSGVPEVLADAGRLVREGDVAGLVEALAEIAADPETRAGMGARGRARAVERHGLDSVVASLRRVYASAL